jgi:hypothetical protein
MCRRQPQVIPSCEVGGALDKLIGRLMHHIAFQYHTAFCFGETTRERRLMFIGLRAWNLKYVEIRRFVMYY